MFNEMLIQSFSGVYRVNFEDNFSKIFLRYSEKNCHFLVDSNVAKLYSQELQMVLSHPNLILIDALEKNKSIQSVIPIMERIVSNNVRRSHRLIAIGGGIVQDITCFIASLMLRGLEWEFIPTTLLSQADSCIGSKSSINLGNVKNILGTFNPPKSIYINQNFLATLSQYEIFSGIGEILKVHIIDGPESFNVLANDYDSLLKNKTVLLRYIKNALEIKRRFIEADEFDLGIRNIFNYGHSFGHAIESATDFKIPHGIAVTIGMDIANKMAVLRGLLPQKEFDRMHPILERNYHSLKKVPVPFDLFMSALKKDKKNTTENLILILPVGSLSSVEKVEICNDELFRSQCQKSLAEICYE